MSADPNSIGGLWDRHGNPISMWRWVELTRTDRRVAQTRDLKLHGRTVSTVWLGLWHGEDEQHRPLIFETMVFDKDGTILDMCRVATLEEAKDAHATMCAKWELEDSLAREEFDKL